MRLLYYNNINNIMSCHNECSSNIYSNSKIYEPTSSHRLNVYPVTPIATLYNYYQGSSENECNTNNVINKGNKIILDVIDLAEDEFFNMFYYTSAKYFCINKANTSSRSIVLACQTYIANDSRVHKLSLYNEVIKSFEQNYNVSANNINSAALISLQREVYGTQSLASICGSQLGLSWDQVIANLISCDYIEHGCKNSVAIIIFQVNLNYHSCALNVDLTITFQYKVPIFGYILKNVPIPYSNAEEFFFNNQYSDAEELYPNSNIKNSDDDNKEEDSNIEKYESEEGSNLEESEDCGCSKKNKTRRNTSKQDDNYLKKNKTLRSDKYTIKPKYNIQSLANKLKDIEELILDTNDDEFEFSDSDFKENESKHSNSDIDDDDFIFE